MNTTDIVDLFMLAISAILLSIAFGPCAGIGITALAYMHKHPYPH